MYMLYTSSTNSSNHQHHEDHQNDFTSDLRRHYDIDMNEDTPIKSPILPSEHIEANITGGLTTSSSSSSSSSSFATPHTPTIRPHSHNPSQIPSQTTAPASQISTPLPSQDDPSISLDMDRLTTSPNPHPTTTTNTSSSSNSTTNNAHMNLNTASNGYSSSSTTNASLSPFSILCGGGAQREMSQREVNSRNGMMIGSGSGVRRSWLETAPGPGLGQGPGQGLGSGVGTTTSGPGSLYSNSSFSNTLALKHRLLSSRSSMIREQNPSQNPNQNPCQMSAPTSQINP